MSPPRRGGGPRLAVENDKEPQEARGDRNGGGNGGDIRERLARLEEQVQGIKEHMAVKNDVTSVKVWVLVGALTAVVTGVGIAVTVALIVARAFGGSG